jgi:phosphosulfolactate phosphohydrolase-like enzyme
VRGFDFGNSPTEIEAAELPPGAMVVPSTTNGTRIIEVAQGAFAILAGAFVNAHTVADELAVGAYGERVAVIGCGWEGGRASEDESAAGAILCRLRQRGVGLDKRVRRVVELYLRAPRRRFAAPEQRRSTPHTPRVRVGYRFLPRREYRAGRPSSRRRYLREPAVEGCWP